MKRGKPLKPGKPMRRGKKLERKKPLVAKKPLKAKSAPKPGRAAGPTRDVVDAVLDRAAHSCERCGRGVGPVRFVDYHIHHRRLKGRGGTDKPDAHLPQNLLLLCPPCHELVHGPDRAEIQRCGWIVPSTGDPALVPVVLWLDHFRYLTPSGGYSPYPPRWKEGDPS